MVPYSPNFLCTAHIPHHAMIRCLTAGRHLRPQSTAIKSLSTASTKTAPAATDAEKRQLQSTYAFSHIIPPKGPNPKFKSPRKRANILFRDINTEKIQNNVQNNADVLQVPFNVGDAIEITMVDKGGVNSDSTEKIRGIVIARVNRGLGSSVIVRDVLFGYPVERQVPLHSPLLKGLKVLEKNFLHKGKKKVKRAKLYYLRDRLPVYSRVTK